jgi:hypothetical protein
MFIEPVPLTSCSTGIPRHMGLLDRLLVRNNPRPQESHVAREPRSSEAPHGPIDGIPPWAVSSVMVFLAPFWTNRGLVERSYHGGASFGDEHRDFLREVERNLRVPFDWRHGSQSACNTLMSVMARDNQKMVEVVDFALKHIELGYGLDEAWEAPRALDRALAEAGSVWSVAGDPNGYSLRRRVTEVGDALARQPQSGVGNAASELRTAYDKAYGREPEASAAYRHAIKAVEAAAIPVISPNNASATLGTVIADMRQSPAKWTSVLVRPARKIGTTKEDITSVEVTMALMDQLWHNQTDRHSPGDNEPTVPITSQQAEWAVHTAALLVQIFRSGWIS